MRVTEIRVGFARTLVPPGGDRYQPVKLDAGLTVSLDEGDDPVKVRAAVQADLRAILEETYRAQVKPARTAELERREPTQQAGFKPAEPEY